MNVMDVHGSFFRFLLIAAFACGLVFTPQPAGAAPVEPAPIQPAPLLGGPDLPFQSISVGEMHTCALRPDGSLTCWGDDIFGQSTMPAGTYTQVSAGASHTCALRTDGSLTCWGDNTYGQMTVPAPPTGLTYTQVSAGRYHTCALRSDGSLTCWGLNNAGQTTVPAPPTGLTYTQVSAGVGYTCALRSDGSLTCWGIGSDGMTVPALPAGLNYTQVNIGIEHTCALRSDGSLTCWGYNTYGQATVPALPAGLTYTQVSAGHYDHTCALRSDGSLTCWGDNTYGQTTVPALPAGLTYVQVGAGARHTCALLSDGSLTCWGDNIVGQTTVPISSPVLTYSQVSAGTSHTCGLHPDGSLLCWGRNTYGQTNAPALPAGLTYTQVSAGASYTCARLSDGSVDCWGSNTSGQTNVPPLPSGLTYTQVSAGGYHACARLSDGSVDCWGSNTFGQTNVPALPSGVTYTQVSAGLYHTCALRSDSNITCWGQNGYGERTVPASSYSAVSAGRYFTCGVVLDGRVTCWGRNDQNQLSAPLPTGATSFTSVSAGGWHACGLLDDNSIRCWGLNSEGQATPPAGTYTQVGAGEYHTCALHTDSTISCWGRNDYGQTAQPAYGTDFNSPAALSSLRADPNPSAAASVRFTVTFNEFVVGVNAADFTLTMGAGVSGASVTSVSGSGKVYTVTVNTGSGDGTLRLNFRDNDSVRDAVNLPTGGIGVGNGDYSGGETYTIEKTPPSLLSFVRQTPATSPTNADALVFRATFSEQIQNVDSADFAISGTTATITSMTTVTVGRVYDIAVSGGDLTTLNGTVGLNLAAGQNIQDLANKPLPTTEPAIDETYVVTNAALLSFTRQTPAASLTNADTLVFRAAFSGGVQSVDPSDFVASGTTATVSGVTGVGAGPNCAQYDIAVSGGDLAGLNGTVGLNLVAGQNIQDLAGAALPAGEPATDETYVMDNTAPALTSFMRQTPAASPTNADTLVFRATFSEDVQNLNASDFVVSGTTATITAVMGVGVGTYTQYDLTVSGGDLAGLNGTVGLNLAAGQNIQDLAGNALPIVEPVTDQTYVVDNTAPTLTSFTRQTPATSPTNADTLVFRVTFSEDVKNVTADDFTVNGTTAGLSVATVSASTYDITVLGGDLADLNDTVGLNLAAGQDIQDLEGNALPAGEPVTDETYEMENAAPSVASQTLQASYMGMGPSSFTVTFSETVNNAGGGAGVNDAANPNNYVLMEQGWASGFQTTACNSIDAVNDARVTPGGVTYTPNTATITLTGALPAGSYRLFVCGTTSIVDLANNPLNGGADFTFSFDVMKLPDTGFAPNRVTRLPRQPAELAYTKMDDLWLEIPSLKVKAAIFSVPRSENDWDVKWLGDGVGWLNGTVSPTREGNSVLAAHARGADGFPGPFAKLGDLQYGEQVIVHTPDRQYVFEIRNKRVVSPDSTSFAFEQLEGTSYLTLITCAGYNNGTYGSRRLVRAMLVEVK